MLVAESKDLRKVLTASVDGTALVMLLLKEWTGVRGIILEVERAHIYRARAEPELFTSSPDEPEPMDFGHRAGFEPSLNQFFQFFGAELTLEPEKKARSSL